MENLRPVKFITLIVLATLLPQATFAYHTNTHSQLTKQTIQAYNALNKERTLTAKDIKNIAKGSVDEDDGKRPLRHFYDPISGKGLFGINMAAPVWALDTLEQANYGWNNLGKRDKLFSDATDYSWNRAIYEYSYGDRARAMQTLGHILHLVQDASVPAHVRNDDHLSRWGWGDINLYEEYTHKIEPNVQVSGIKNFNSFDDIYKDLARFTNKNFLSKDTVFKGYALPKRDGLKLERSTTDGPGQYFGINNNGKLVRIERIRNKEELGAPINEIYGIDDKENKILANYYNILSNKAGESGVATIDLFFREVALEKKTLTLKYMNKSQKDIEHIASTISGFGIAKGFSLIASSLSPIDAYELNKADWEGARRAAAIFGISFPPKPKGESAIAEDESKYKLQKTKLPKPAQPRQKFFDEQIRATIIRGTPSGENEIITPEQQLRQQAVEQAEPKTDKQYEQMSTALLAMEKLLKQLMLKRQIKDEAPDICAGIDLSIIKNSTCISPFDPGGYGFGAGGGGRGEVFTCAGDLVAYVGPYGTISCHLPFDYSGLECGGGVNACSGPSTGPMAGGGD